MTAAVENLSDLITVREKKITAAVITHSMDQGDMSTKWSSAVFEESPKYWQKYQRALSS